jgi:D-beta-D-heptose 7-phosphate kinase/D-beta-D-heptose 1-phosphate adenosyltransferase
MNSKIISRSGVAPVVSELKRQGKKIVFTNGCFDLLHVGHVSYLQEAASLGDCLVVGLNDDQSVRMIKGPKRPLISEDQRAEVLAALACIGYVVLFSEADPYELIKVVRPDILVKGADWSPDKIIGADLVESYGGKVCRVDLVPQISTSEIIDRIISRYTGPTV